MQRYQWEEETGSPKDASGLPRNSAERLGFCRKVLRKGLHSRKTAEGFSHRTPKVLQSFGSQAQLFNKFSDPAHASPNQIAKLLRFRWTIAWNRGSSTLEHNPKRQCFLGAQFWHHSASALQIWSIFRTPSCENSCDKCRFSPLSRDSTWPGSVIPMATVTVKCPTETDAGNKATTSVPNFREALESTECMGQTDSDAKVCNFLQQSAVVLKKTCKIPQLSHAIVWRKKQNSTTIRKKSAEIGPSLSPSVWQLLPFHKVCASQMLFVAFVKRGESAKISDLSSNICAWAWFAPPAHRDMHFADFAGTIGSWRGPLSETLPW